MTPRPRSRLTSASSGRDRRATGPDATSTSQPPLACVEQRGGAEPERRRAAGRACRRPSPGRASEPASAASASASACSAGGAQPAAPDAVDEHGDDAGGDDVDDEGEDVLAVGDVKPVVRRREVPVGEQEAADARRRRPGARRRRGRRPSPARGTAAARSAGRPVAEVGARQRDQRQADGDEHPAPQLAARRQRGEDLAHRRGAAGRVPSSSPAGGR